MEDIRLKDLPFDQQDADDAIETLKEYKRGKTSIDQKATENQEWWRLRHWRMLHGKSEVSTRDVGSAWTFNSIINKHADIMDSFPKPNVLAREADDEEEARALSKILPVVLEENDYENVYDRKGYDILIDGGALTGVFWDNAKADGMGDISITNIDVHNLFWQPGVSDIQDSEYLFHVSQQDAEQMKQQWPDYADEIEAYDPADVVKYIHDDNIDYSKTVEVVDCYYKRVVMEAATDSMGTEIIQIPKTILHLAKIIGGVLVFCSENEQGYEDGYYWHGQYPFVVARQFPVKDTPWGFGYLDVMKHPQADIDKLDQAIVKNAMMKAKPRFWVKKSADINVKDFADWEKDIVEVSGNALGDAVKQIEVDTVSASVANHLINKIEELKETSGNRDFSQGSTASGITAASAIAALQEAGSKLSRNLNKTMYRASRQEYYLCIELMRQFYTEDRSFRIDDEYGGYEYTVYNNENINPIEFVGGERRRKPVFDIQVSAEKSSPFSRAAQNETAKELYSLGLFQPENAQAALVCINMMDFEGRDSIKQQITNNAEFLQQMQQMQAAIMEAEQYLPGIAARAGLIEDPMAMGGQPPGPGADMEGTPEERAAQTDGEIASVVKARQRAANQAAIG